MADLGHRDDPLDPGTFEEFANTHDWNDNEHWDRQYIMLTGTDGYEREDTPEDFGQNVQSNIKLEALDPEWGFAHRTPDSQLKIDKGVSKKPSPHKPRPYQLEVFERSRHQNVILHMNTGLGKTMCAAMLINEALEKEDGKLVFFLAPQVPLVNQQAQFIHIQCPKAEVRRLHGQLDIGHEAWDHADWVSVLNAGGNVFVLTAGMLHHLLIHAHIRMSDIKLLIFDECHHNGSLDEYNLIMSQHYMRMDVPLRPRVFCMSAPMVTGNPTPEQLKKQIKKLQATYDAVVVQPDENSVAPYDIEPEHRYWHYEAEDPGLFETKYAHQWPEWGMNETRWMKEQGDFKAVLFELGELPAIRLMDSWCSARTKESSLHKARTDGTITPLLENKLLKHQDYVDRKAEMVTAWADFRQQPENISHTQFVESNKITRLKECLLKFKQARSGIQDKCIVLVERRIVAEWLCDSLQREFHTSGGKAVLGVGKVISSSRTGHGLCRGQMQCEQRDILVGFRSTQEDDPKRLDVVIATSILEEGIDVPTCKLVIRFNPSMTAKTDIQSAGRARAVGSKYVHMVSSHAEDKELGMITRHHTTREHIHEYTKFRQRDVKTWTPARKKELKDFTNPLYNERTGAFISEALAYRKVHETYTRFDKDLDFQVQWKNFSETPFNRENFREVMAPGISGDWFGTEVKREEEIVHEGKHVLRIEHEKRNRITGTLEINKESFQIFGKYNRLRPPTGDNPGFVTGEFRVKKGKMYELGKFEFTQNFTYGKGNNGEKLLLPQHLDVKALTREVFERDDDSVYYLPDSFKFEHTSLHQPKYFESKRKEKFYHHKNGRSKRRPKRYFEKIHKHILTLPAIISESKRPPMEEQILEGPVRFTTKESRGAVSIDALRLLFNRGILDDRFCVVGRNLRLNVVGMSAHDDDPVEFVERVLPPLVNITGKSHPFTYVLHQVSIEMLGGEVDPLFGILLPQACHETNINIFPIDQDSANITQDCTITPIREVQLTPDQHEMLVEFHKVVLMCVEVKPQWNPEKLKEAPDVMVDCLIIPVTDDKSDVDWERAQEIGCQTTDWAEWATASEFIQRGEPIEDRIARTTYAYYYYELLDIDETQTIESIMCQDIPYREHYEVHHGLEIDDDYEENMIRAHGYTATAYNACADPQELRQLKKDVFLVPMFCAVLPINKHEHKYMRYFPSLLWRLECMEVIRLGQTRLEEYTGVNICYPCMYQSLTTPAVDYEADMNYNRAEFMGDSVLLWLIARLAYNMYPEDSPIALTTHVNKRISNEFLAEQMKKLELQLQKYIIGERFARKRWDSPGVPVANHLREQELSRNTIADCHEALIYSAFIDPVVRENLNVTDTSPLEDCRRLKDFQKSHPELAFVSPFDGDRLDVCLANAELFVTKMMKLPDCTILDPPPLPPLPLAVNREETYAPSPATAELLGYCNSELRKIDPFLERHPRNLGASQDPNVSLEEALDKKYSDVNEPMCPSTTSKVVVESRAKVRSQRKADPTILASGQEVVPNTTLPVPSSANKLKSVILRSFKVAKIPLENDVKEQLITILRDVFADAQETEARETDDADFQQILMDTYRRVWTDAGYIVDENRFSTEVIDYRKIRRAYLRTKSMHQLQFASRATDNPVNLDALEAVFGYTFRNRDLLQQALIHTSINANLSKHHTYQRMEFLGDAALGICVSLDLYCTYPEWEEGQMSHAKSAIVSNSYFARKLYRRFLGAGLNLEDFLITKSEEMREGIREFMTIFKETDDDLLISLEINMTPRNDRGDRDTFIYPKILGDVYEAIAGAILIDSDWSLSTMWNHMHTDLQLSDEQCMILQENLDAIKEIDENKARAGLDKYLNQGRP